MSSLFAQDAPLTEFMKPQAPNAYELMGLDSQRLHAEIEALEKENEYVLRKYHSQWFFQIAMRIGAQWLERRADGISIVPETQGKKIRMVINRILPAHQTKLAKIIKTKPWVEVAADKHSYKSRKQARKCNRLLDYIYAEQNVEKKIKTTATWTLDAGTAFLYPWWDTMLGEEIVGYQQQQGPYDPETAGYKVDGEGYILDEQGQRIAQSYGKTGDVRIDFVSPFDVRPYRIRPDGSAKGVILHCSYDVEDLKQMFPDHAEDIHEEKESNDKAVDYYKQIIGLISNEQYSVSNDKSTKGRAVVKQLFEEPSPQYQNGRHVISICGKIVHAGALPYKHLRIPLVKFVDIENSGQYFGMATVQNMCPVQKGYNRAWSQFLRNVNKHGNMKWVASDNCEIEEDALNDSEDEVITYAEGATPPKEVSPPSMPAHFMQLLTNLFPNAFEDVSGQHEVSNAQAPGGVTAAKALDLLQGQDDTRHAPTQIDFNTSMIELGEQILSLYEEFTPANRKFRIKGSGRVVEISPEDLKDVWKNVRIRSSSRIGHDLASNQGELKDLWKDGLFGDPLDPRVRRKVMEMYEFGDLEGMFEDEDADTEWSQEENDLLLDPKTDPRMFGPVPADVVLATNPDGTPKPQVATLPVQIWEDHSIHLYNHNNLRKSQEYREASPEIRARIDAHCDWTVAKKMGPAPTPSPDGKKVATPPAGPPAGGGGQPPPPVPGGEPLAIPPAGMMPGPA